jgi:acid phosphatase
MRCAPLVIVAAAVCAALAGCGSTASSSRSSRPAVSARAPSDSPVSTPTALSSPPSAAPPRSAPPPSAPGRAQGWQHVVIAVMENHASTQIVGSPDAPFLNSLARTGLSFTDLHAETHPSQPNYLALFSGSTQGVPDDRCDVTRRGPDLGSQLRAAGWSFTGYAEGLPAPGSSVCTAYPYARRHCPWVDFTDLPASVNQPLRRFPSDYAALPTVSFVVPDVLDDEHDGTVATSDAWLRRQLGGYAGWARTHHSLLIVTWDEDDNTTANRIATMAVGQGITPQRWTARASHYTLLRSIEDAFGLRPLGGAAHVAPVPALVGTRG